MAKQISDYNVFFILVMDSFILIISVYKIAGLIITDLLQ